MSLKFLVLISVIASGINCFANPSHRDDDQYMHQRIHGRQRNIQLNSAETDSQFWQNKAERLVQQHIDIINKGVAKNVIFFLGDGMSIPTLAATRVYMGQLEGKTGEEQELSFEKFPVTGLSKTYCIDIQVADSACTATAYLGGVKGNDGTIGVNAKVQFANCEQMMNVSNHVDSIAKKFLNDGRSAGLVTTTRVTHASPAGVYSHTSSRDWENDRRIKQDGGDPTKCRDIAHQLVHGDVGKQLKVILGGGRREFLPSLTVDEEYSFGYRTDDRNLIEEWKETKKNHSHAYIWNKDQLLNLNSNIDYLLGLFESSHCQYNLLANKTTEPTLQEMMEVAIRVLSKNEKGYFLFVEGGRIDHAHHDNWARLALDETVEFSKAVERAVSMTNRNDTLIMVTSDHSHAMTYNGYPLRGNDILGPTEDIAEDGTVYMTLSYANGRGYRKEVNNQRVDPTKDPIYGEARYRYPAMVPLDSETHGGDDVGVFALGPWQHLFTGTYEQNAIPYFIEYAACLDQKRSVCSSGTIIGVSFITFMLFTFNLI